VKAVALLDRMIKLGVNPNAVTVTALVESFGKCIPPRVEEAKSLINKLDNEGLICKDDKQIATAFIKVCTTAGDFEGATMTFHAISDADLYAMNAYLHCCCCMGEIKIALSTFDEYSKSKGIKPDVLSYSTLIYSLLKIDVPETNAKARDLYDKMKVEGIMPDTTLIDNIFTTIKKKSCHGT